MGVTNYSVSVIVEKAQIDILLEVLGYLRDA
jgi:hypothetical protein